MGIIKKLASQTAIYGISSIFGRFLNYLLVPLYTYYFSAAEYGVVSEFYAYAGFFSVLLLFGFETGYFRFRDKEHTGRDVAYSTALIFVVLVNLGFFLTILLVNTRLSAALNYANHPEYVLCFTLILTLDAIASIPFARLRAEDKSIPFCRNQVDRNTDNRAAQSVFYYLLSQGLRRKSAIMDSPYLFSSDWYRLYFYCQPDCQYFQVFVACTAVKGLGLGI